MTTTKELPSDLTKLLGEWAVAAGRYLQSEQTRYLHYSYSEENLKGAQTIPLVENALFILALLRSRIMEQIQEAKALLKGLLAFQNLQQDNFYGNFPVYLHQYPICIDPSLSLQLLAPFYWILLQFGHILGLDLRIQLEQACRLALENSLACHKTNPFPYSIAVRLASAQISYGTLWGQFDWQKEGNEQLERLAEHQLDGWSTTQHLGNLLVGLQMVYPSLMNSPWKQLWHRMEQTWHFQTGCYIGPCLREWQEGEEPQINLYDLYAGYFARRFSRRASLLQPLHLYAAMIIPSSDKFEVAHSTFIEQGTFKEQVWQMVCDPEWAYTILEKKEPYHPSIDKTHTPYRLIWGDSHRAHSFICQGGCYEKVEYTIEKYTTQLVFDLKDSPIGDKFNQNREIEFFVDFHSDILFTLNGHRSNTFELGQPVILSLGKHKLSLVFELLKGEGVFLGHVMRGNRPSQVDYKGERRFQAHDWTFFLRTLRRQNPCRIQATLAFHPSN
jgi:hypothetical protein